MLWGCCYVGVDVLRVCYEGPSLMVKCVLRSRFVQTIVKFIYSIQIFNFSSQS